LAILISEIKSLSKNSRPTKLASKACVNNLYTWALNCFATNIYYFLSCANTTLGSFTVKVTIVMDTAFKFNPVVDN